MFKLSGAIIWPPPSPKSLECFCTSRSVIGSITTTKKPTSAEVLDEMKKLSDNGVGKFVISEKDKVYYKPIPDEINRKRIVALAC